MKRVQKVQKGTSTQSVPRVKVGTEVQHPLGVYLLYLTPLVVLESLP